MVPLLSRRPRPSLPTLALALGATLTSACTTTTATAGAPMSASSNPASGAAAAATTPTSTSTSTTTSEREVLVLRERVARLEKRLADVDARLGLLLARGETAPASAPRPLRFDEPRGEQRAVDLLPPPGDPLAAIDIDRAGPADDGPPIVDVEPSSGPDESVHLTLKGTPRSADDDTSGDPLAAFQSAEELYGWAQEKRKDARYLEAIAGFEDVVSRFAVHDLADNAAYWVGWCHQQRGDHRLALDVWQKLPAKYPRSAKVPDALFGMGQSHEALGEPALAEALYDEVVSSYPKAEKLKDARKALARLRPPQR